MSELDAAAAELEELLRLWQRLSPSQKSALIRLCEGIVGPELPENQRETRIVNLRQEGEQHDRSL